VPRSRGVGGHFFDAGLQRGEPGFEVGRVGHGEQRTDLATRRQGVRGVPVAFRSLALRERLTRGRPRRAVDGQAQRQPTVDYQK
jgi:hypothetical protein